MSPGTALGFFWALGGVDRYISSTINYLIALTAAAERKQLYRFSVDLGKLALRIVERHGTNADRWHVTFIAASLSYIFNAPSVALWSCIAPWCPLMITFTSAQTFPA
jgi:hypothetical protein